MQKFMYCNFLPRF